MCIRDRINVLVMAAGGYTFGDFVRVGLPLAVVMWIAYTASLLSLIHISEPTRPY